MGNCCGNDATNCPADMADSNPIAALPSDTMKEEVVKEPVIEAPSAVSAKAAEAEKQLAPASDEIEADEEMAVRALVPDATTLPTPVLEHTSLPTPVPEATPQEFTITLKKTPENCRLGFSVDIASSVFLVVERVNGGLLAAWNQFNADKEVKCGDRIITVNGQSGDAVVLTQVIKHNDVLEMKVVRKAPD